MGNFAELNREILRAGRRVDCILLDTNTHGVSAQDLMVLRSCWDSAVVQYWVDQRTTLQDEIANRAGLIDTLVWTNKCPAQAWQAKTAGVRAVEFLPAPSDDGIFFPVPGVEKDHDLIFVGHDYHGQMGLDGEDRRQAVRVCLDEFQSFRLVGEGWEWTARQTYPEPCFRAAADLVQRSRVALSISHYRDIPAYTSDRLLNMIFSGVPTVAQRFAGWEEVVRPGWCWWYDAPGDLPGIVRGILADYQAAQDKALRASHEARTIYGRQRWAAKMAHYIQGAIECRKGR